jgi:uncharacterized membrane protein YqaE (UPF0057 family)
MDIVDKIFDPVFGPILGPITGIIDAMIMLVKVIIIVLTAIPQLLMAALQILNPINLVNDAITGVFMSIKIIVVNLFGFLTTGKSKYNKCQDTGEGVFGFRRTRNKEGKLVKGQKCGKDKVCRKNNLFKYITAVLCPPLALFLHIGVGGWFHVIICTVLTVYAYYFPGLIYALLHVMNFVK